MPEVTAGLRRGRRGRRVAGTEPDEHHFRVGIHVCERGGAHLGEGLHGITVHFGDARHRVALREDTAEAGADQQVPAFDVGVAGQVGERERGRVARAHRDGTQPGARHEYRHGVLGIGDEDDFRAPGADMGGLTDESLVIEHRLPLENAVEGAAVEKQPLPPLLDVVRPAFLVLAVLYWSVNAPRTGGLAIGFFAGLMLDVFQGPVLGEHALALSLVTYIAVREHQRIRSKPVIQQALIVFAALIVYEVVLFMIDGWTGHPVTSPLRWVHTVTGALIWPPAAAILSYGAGHRV